MSVGVEWLILADGAQVVGNKLYLLGGGWDLLTVNRPFPVSQHLAVAASFLVPWQETNTRHDFEIEILNEDGGSLARIAGQVEVGRPPGLPPGSDQRSQIAVEMNLEFARPGVYVLTARIQGREAKRTAFRVVAGPAVGGG